MKKAIHSATTITMMMSLFCCFITPKLQAQVFDWNLNGNGNWSTAGNWTPGGGPPNAIDDTANFGTVITGNRNVTVDINVTVGQMDFFHNTGNREYNIIGANTITFDVGSGNATLTVDMQDRSRIAAPIVLNDDLDFFNANTQNFRLQGNISGSGGITHQGGRLTFQSGGVSSYTGDTIVEDGQLRLARTSANGGIGGDLTIGDGVGAAGSAIVDYGNNNDQISDTSAVTILSDGLLDLTDENDTIGSLSSSSTAAQVMLGGAAPGILTVGDATNVTFAGVISERGDIVKQGDGTWTLTNNNTYDGTTTINNGILEIEDASALGDTTNDTTVNSGGTLALDTGITVVGEGLTLNGTGESSAGALQNIAGANEWQGTVDLGSAATINSTAGSLDVSGNIDNQTFNLTVDGAGDTTFSGIVSDTGDLIKDDTGTLTLSGVNTYSGDTTINDGTISISADSGLGATGSTITFDGGTLNTTATFTLDSTRGTTLNAGDGTIDTNAATTLTYGGVISGAGDLDKTGSGTLVLDGVNTYTGITTVQTGTLDITDTNALGGTGSGTVVQSGATLEVSNIAANMAAESLTINGTGVGGVNGALHWTDTGTQRWTGNVTLGSDSLIVVDAGNMRFTGDIDLNGSDLTMDNDVTARLSNGGILTGTGNLIKEGTGTFRFDGGGVNDYVGDATVNTGRLRLGGTAGATKITGDLFIGDGTGATGADRVILGSADHIADTSAVTINSTGRLDLNDNNETIGSLTGATATAQVFLGTATLTAGDASNTTFAGVISETGDLVKEGTGTLTLSGVNTFTGTTSINNGTLSISADSGLGTAPGVATAGHLSFDGGTLNTSVTFSLDSNRGIALNAGDGTVDTDFGTTLTYGGIMAGTGDLTKDGTGTLTLSGVNTYTGSTTIDGGTLSISADSGLGAAPGAATAGHLSFDGGTLNTSATFSLDSNRGIALNAGGGTIETDAATTLTYGGIMAGTGSFDKTGTGTLVLGGVNTYTGTTTVQAGTLEVTDPSALGGTGSGTVVQSGATLEVSGIAANMSAEPLTINGTGVGGVGALYWTDIGFDEWTGDITLGSNATITNAAGGIMPISGDIDLNGSTLTVDTGDLAGMVSGSVISGTGNFVKDGTSTWFFQGGTNTYTGSTTINDGTMNLNVSGGTSVPGALVIGDGVGATGSAIAFVGSSEQIADTSAVTIDSDGRLDVNSFSETIGSLSSGSATAEVFLDAGTLTVGDATSTTFAGVISETGDLMKEGTGTLTLTGTNSFSGDTTVNAGTLELNNGAGNALDGTATVIITGGSLLLSGDDQIVDTANMELDGGIFDTDGFDEVLGTLTLSSDSSIDLGIGTSIIDFDDSSGLELAWTDSGQILSILDYTGDTNGGGIDQIIFGSAGLTDSQLAQIRFVNPWGTSKSFHARFQGDEIVPVPEPSTYLGGGLILTLIGWRERRRLIKLLGKFQEKQ